MSGFVGLGRRALILSLMVALLVLGAIGLFAYLRSPTRGLPYHDSFAAGKAGEWQAYGGTWQVEQGSMRDDSNERGAKLLTGSRYWQNYSIEADVMLLSFSGYASDAGLIVRSSDEEEGVYAYRGYFASLHTVRGLGSTLTLGRAGYGVWSVSSPLKTRLQASTWYHLKLLVYGCQVIAMTSTSPSEAPTVVSMTDDGCLQGGRIGLHSSHSGGVWRNVVVRPATQRDLDQMLAQGQSQDIPPLAQLRGRSPSLALQSTREINEMRTNEIQAHEMQFSPNAVPIGSLRLAALSQPEKVTISGQVILTSPALYVQDSTGGVVIHPSSPQSLKIGDEVEAIGVAHSNDLGSTLDNATVHILWDDTPMPAVSVTSSQAATGAYDATFIEIEGHLSKKQLGQDGSLIFDFDAGSQSFRAIMSGGRGKSFYNVPAPGSLMRVRGVAVVDPIYTQNLTPFAVLVSSNDDVKILDGPSWWSAGHLVFVGVCLILLAVITNTLYHRVEQWRLRGIVEERERLAYEMHDTLAQSVAGIGFQLEAIRFGIPKELVNAHQQLALARELILHSHAEARRSVEMLRPRELESQSLLQGLTSCARHLVAGGSVRVIAASTGDLRPIPLRTADTLYRIGQEALANAVRHANPTTLTITLEYEKDAVRLLIGDDGSGLVADMERDSLGILGMRKRASTISAELEIRSTPGEGTWVSITALLPRRVTLFTWPVVLGRFLKEHIRNVKDLDKLHSHSDRR